MNQARLQGGFLRLVPHGHLFFFLSLNLSDLSEVDSFIMLLSPLKLKKEEHRYQLQGTAIICSLTITARL